MPPQTSRATGEERIAHVQQTHLLGTFRIRLAQTENHPDQRALDTDWVTQLKEKIGSPDVLNRGLHPIGVILKDDQQSEQLRQLVQKSKGAIPDLPNEIGVLVFAGQHRLAMLQDLELEGPDDRWWHGKVYLNSLERKHPAEFLTMMHESNAPRVLKPNQDADMFRATAKLGTWFHSGIIDRETYLQNRQALWACLTITAKRSLANLSRNQEVMEAVSQALSRPHIAKVFNAGSWVKITKGRLHGVVAGLVKEMVCQVDLLTEGLTEVPTTVTDIRAASCTIEKLEKEAKSRDPEHHSWACLEGGLKGALQRVKQRPHKFVTSLNPTGTDPWSVPDLVLIPSSLGATRVEEEVNIMHKVVQHLLRMCAKEEHYNSYGSSNPDPIETPTDHPAGMIAAVITDRREKQGSRGYEHKILNTVWKSRARLLSELEKYAVPKVEQATKEHYERLIEQSESWWQVLKLFKVTRFRTGLCLTVPSNFGSSVDRGEEAAEEPQSRASEASRRSSTEDVLGAGAKRSREEQPARSASMKRPRQSDGDGTMQDAQIHHVDQGPTVSRQSSAEGEGRGNVPSSGGQDVRGGGEVRIEEDLLDKEYEPRTDSEGEEASRGHKECTSERVGGDRLLTGVLADIEKAVGDMTRRESRALTSVLLQVLAAKETGKMAEMTEALESKAMRMAKKLSRSDQAQYEAGADEI
ncbi:hypothetical protein FRC12_005468 [Ceratobasidium sp. 428]|nr:hypothetical protein FRC12_005468 [Ceratobasidium sp. 428]